MSTYRDSVPIIRKVHLKSNGLTIHRFPENMPTKPQEVTGAAETVVSSFSGFLNWMNEDPELLSRIHSCAGIIQIKSEDTTQEPLYWYFYATESMGHAGTLGIASTLVNIIQSEMNFSN